MANKPSLDIMMDEIKMIWNLGKLDQLYREKENLLKSKDRKLFLKFFESVHDKFQKDLGLLKLVNNEQLDSTNVLEMEVFRETPRKRKVN